MKSTTVSTRLRVFTRNPTRKPPVGLSVKGNITGTAEYSYGRYARSRMHSVRLFPVAEAVRNGEDYLPLVSQIYPTLEKVSIDYAVMEKADEVIMVELPCEWIDLGSWSSLEDIMEADECGNVVKAGNCEILDGRNNIIVSGEDDHLIAVLGVEDSIVIHTQDATLVCKRSEGQKIKDIVESIGERFDGRFV